MVNAAYNLQLKKALTTYNTAFDYNGDWFVNTADNLQFKNSQSTSFRGWVRQSKRARPQVNVHRGYVLKELARQS